MLQTSYLGLPIGGDVGKGESAESIDHLTADGLAGPEIPLQGSMGEEHVAGSAQAEGVSLVGAGGRVGAGEDMGALQVIGGAAAPASTGLPDESGEDAIGLRSVVPPSSCHRRWLRYPLSRLGVTDRRIGGAERSNGGVLDGAPLFRLGWSRSLRKVLCAR